MLFSRIISYVFHPLLLPTLGLFLIFRLGNSGLWLSPPPEIQLLLFTATAAATFFLPLLTVLLLLKMKLVSSLEMQAREERRIPYLAASAFYFSESYFLIGWEVPAMVRAMIFGYTILVLGVLVINLFWKISAHMAGIGGLCGMMIAISSRMQIDIHSLLIGLFLAAGLIAYSRLKLSAHNPAQVYIGFLLGLSVQLVLFL